ncbi:MAG: hypothetical protein AAF958_14405 [Planctomycetota bacterium]
MIQRLKRWAAITFIFPSFIGISPVLGQTPEVSRREQNRVQFKWESAATTDNAPNVNWKIRIRNAETTDPPIEITLRTPADGIHRVWSDVQPGGKTLRANTEYLLTLFRDGKATDPNAVRFTTASSAELRAKRDQPNSCQLTWLPVIGATSYEVTLRRDGSVFPDSNNPFVVSSETNAQGFDFARPRCALIADDAYEVVVRPMPRGATFMTTIPPFKSDNTQSTKVFGKDPIAQRLEAVARNRRANAAMNTDWADVVRSKNEYMVKRRNALRVLEAAVGHELERQREYVKVYFDKQRINLIGKMDVAELTDMRRDQKVYFKKEARRRRYNKVLNEAPLKTGRYASSLNTVRAMFVGTPLGYGDPIELIVGDGDLADRFRLTEQMLGQLRVKSGSGIEFRLNDPKPLPMDWPKMLRTDNFKKIRKYVDEQLTRLEMESVPEEQEATLVLLDDIFTTLYGQFLDKYPPSRERPLRPDYREIKKAEDFLRLKRKELGYLSENPAATLAVSKSFIPQLHGRDAGTLVAWMNSRGVEFVRPRAGEEQTYQRLFMMLHELYAISGAPIMDIVSNP